MGWMGLGYILACFIAWHMWSNFICLEPRFLIPDSRLLILIQHVHIYVISWNKQHCKKFNIENSSSHIYFFTNSDKSKQPIASTQVDCSDPSCCSLSPSTGWSTGTWWWLRWLSDSCSSYQTCCGSEIFLCCNSWLKTHWDHQFTATFWDNLALMSL